MNRIAVLVDSGCSVPPEIAQEGGIYTLPLKMNYTDRTYYDGVDITPQEMYARLEEEIPTTSLPSMEEATEKLEEIKKDGYTQVLCIHISSNLSGTYNIVRLAAEEMEGMDIRLIDTKNISIGSGFLALYARELIGQGVALDEIVTKLEERVATSHVFFCVDTLKYLQKGGRIGLVGSILGTTLNLKPIISCNDDGIYYTVAKVRGKRHALDKMLEVVAQQVEGGVSYDICVCNGGAGEEYLALYREVQERFHPVHFYSGDISPSLGVHTGPGLVGIGIFRR